MDRVLLALLLPTVCWAPPVVAQSTGFGLGIMLGSPTGVSAKYWTSGDRALDFGVAWGVWGPGSYFHLHGDLLFHKMDLVTVPSGKLPLYFGPGLRMRSWGGGRYWHRGQWYEYEGNHNTLGVRFPVGLAYLFDGAPVDVFLELVPTLELLPGTRFGFDGAIGARYWFR